MTANNLAKMHKEIERLKTEIKLYTDKPIEQIWLEELEELEKVLKDKQLE